MLKGVNDQPWHAKQLIKLLKGIPAKVNLIPFNPWPGSEYECSDWETIETFADIVNAAGYASPIRTPRGRDILAACGQLKLRRTPKMRPALDSLANGFPWLIFYLIVVTIIYIAGLFIYVKLTPHKELDLVQDGNMAAAVSFSALVISLALPLAACLINKFGLVDVALWGTLSLFLQLFLFRLTDAIFKGMPQRIIEPSKSQAL